MAGWSIAEVSVADTVLRLAVLKPASWRVS
jgi:hypothetical protein